MKKNPITISITGAGGQISYSLLFRIASGEVFGFNQPIILSLIELPSALNNLRGVVMELEDCSFPLLKNINIQSDINIGFKDANWILLVGSFPRKAGMERYDLLKINGKIFAEQGKVINKNAASDVRILVVGNPCNTNCLIALNHAPDVPKDRWFAMTRLDENRAKAQLAIKAQIPVYNIKKMIIWGNHSLTQYPDIYNARILDQKIDYYIKDEFWLKNTFISMIQNRGNEIINTRGRSSAASAANAIIDTIQSIIFKNKDENFHSVGIYSEGYYDFPSNLVISMPISSNSSNYNVVEKLEINNFSLSKINISIQELINERNTVNQLIKN